MMASDLSSGCTETIDILDDEKEEGEISLEDVSSSEEGGMGHLTSSYVVQGKTRACPECKSWGECATWCNAMYRLKSQSRRDPVKGKENRHHVRETGCVATKHTASKLQEKNDDLVPISSDSDMEIVGLTDTSNRSKAKVKKKKKKKKDYEPLTIDDLISPSSVDLPIADFSALKIYREVNSVRRPSGRSKVISRSPIRRYKSPLVARPSLRSSRSPLNHSRSPILKKSPRKIKSPKRSPRRHSPVRAAKRSLKSSSPSSTRSYIDRHGEVTRLLKKVKRLDSIGAHASEPSINRTKESSSLKDKLSNMLKKVNSDDHVIHLKRKSKVRSETNVNDADDEDDLALLRQKALETKQNKSNKSSDQPAETEKRLAVNDDQDEEVLQLRMNALRSAVMKKHQNRVRRGIKAKRPTRSESPFTTSFLDDIPVPDDERLDVSSPYSPSHDSNLIEDMDLDTDVEREKEKLPYSPTDKITENVPIDTALLGLEPSDVSFINVNDAIGSPVFDDGVTDELASNTSYYDDTYLSYQALPDTPKCYAYSPSQYGSETFHLDLNDAMGKALENPHGDDIVCDLIDGICCRKETYSSTAVVPDTSHALPGSKDLPSPVSLHDTFVPSLEAQQTMEQSSNDAIVNTDSTFRNDESAYETQRDPGYSIADVPTAMAYARGYTKSLSPSESITIDDPKNNALSCPINDNRNLLDTDYIPKEAISCQVTEETLREPLYMQDVSDVTKDENKIPTLINRTLVPVPILKSNKQLRQHLKRKLEMSHPEPTFKSAEMQPVVVIAADTSSNIFKPIKLQVAKKSAPVLSAAATFDTSTNESLNNYEDQRELLEKNHETNESEHSDVSATPSVSSEASLARSKKRKSVKKNWRKSIDTRLLENEKNLCSIIDMNRDANIVDASTLNRETATKPDWSKSNDNINAQKNLINEELSRLQNVTDTQEPVNSGRVITEKRSVKRNNRAALLTSTEYLQGEHTESHCLSTRLASENSNLGVSDKANTTKCARNRRQSIDEDENELRALLLASLKRTKSSPDTNCSSVAPVIPVTNSAATNVQTPTLKTMADAVIAVNANATTSNNSLSLLPSKPLTVSSETATKKINDLSLPVQSGRKKSNSVDAAKSLPKKVPKKALTSTKVVNNTKKKYQNMIVQRRMNLRKLDNNAKPNVGASKISDVSDTQRFVISLGSDSTDSESESERNEPVPIAEKQAPQEIPADFEKNLNKFLREVRTEQEQTAAAAKSSSSSTQATKRDVPQTNNSSSNMHTPLAVRHLPVSQQEEYRRLKQEILEREKLKLQKKVANNNNSSSSSNKLLNANVASSPVKSLPLCEKKAHVTQNQDKIKTIEKNSQVSSMEIERKSDDMAKDTSESNVYCMSADKKLSASITKHTNFTHLQAKSGKKAIPNDLSIRITNVTSPNHPGGRMVENSRETQSTKEQHKSILKALSKEEINHKYVQVVLKPDTIERVVTINDKSFSQHDTTAIVSQSENPVEPDVSTKIPETNNVNLNDSNFSKASTIILSNSANLNQHEDTMETTITLSEYEAECQQEINRNISATSTENNDSSNISRKFDSTSDGNGNDVLDAFKKDVKAELDSLASLPEVEQERYLRETEHKLVARRYMVLDHLAEMSGNLRQWDMEKDVQSTLANEVRKLKEQLKIAEDRLQQQRDRVSSMGPKVSAARQKINTGRHECDKLSGICSTLGNRLMGKNYKLPEAVAQLLSDKLKEVANHTRQITKKKRLQANDISENSYSSSSQEMSSELSKDAVTENTFLLQQSNDAVIKKAGSKNDTSRFAQSNKSKNSCTETLNFSQAVSYPSTSEKREKTLSNTLEHRNEEQVLPLNQNNALSSEPKQYQSSSIKQNNKRREGSGTNESDPTMSSKSKLSATDTLNQEHNKQSNKRASPQLPSPSPTSSSSPTSSPSLTTDATMPMMIDATTTNTMTTTMTTTTTTATTTTATTTTATTTTTTTTTMTTKTTVTPYVSILMHLKKSRNINPHGILCPYEMMGICRDEDCQYVHQSRNQT